MGWKIQMRESFKMSSAILTVERGVKVVYFLGRGTSSIDCKLFLKQGQHLKAWAAQTHPKLT